MFLHYDEDLQRFGAKIFLMNPKQIANFKKNYSDMNKTDVLDAFVIVEIGQIGRLDDETKIGIILAWRMHQSLVDSPQKNTSLSRNRNQYLRYYWVESNNFVKNRASDYSEYYTEI